MLSRFLIEIPHEATLSACLVAIDVLVNSGSHLLSHADWGCKDGDHKAWLIVEVENKDEARAIVPPAFRSHAKIVQLNSFSSQDLKGMIAGH